MRISLGLFAKFGFGAFGIGCLASQAIAQGAQSDQCELHIWPTRAILANYSDATGFSGSIISAPMPDVSWRLAEAIGPEQQISEISALDLGTTPRFAGYRIVMHEAPMPPRFFYPGNKDLEKTDRLSESKSPCYAELHVTIVSLLKLPMGKKIYSGFLFRDFGSAQIAKHSFISGGGAGAPGFESNGEQKSEAAKKSVRDAFLKSLRTFLGKKKMSKRL